MQDRAGRRARLRARRWEAHDLVFAGRWGQPLDWSNVQTREYKVLLRAAGVPESFRGHDLRHTAASMLIQAGESARLVADWLGHTDVGFTLNTYVHSDPASHRAAVERIEAEAEGA